MRGISVAFSALALLCVSSSPASSQDDIACRTDVTLTAEWDSGYNALVRLTHTGTASLEGWTVRFEIPTDQTIEHLWDGVLAVDDRHATVQNAHYNGSLPSGSSLEFGYTASHAGTLEIPSDFSLEGVACGEAPASFPDPDPSEQAFVETLEYWTYGIPYFSYLARAAERAGAWTTALLSQVELLKAEFGTLRPGSPYEDPPGEPPVAEVPAAPTSLQAEVQGVDRVWLQWTDASEDETGFVLDRQADGAAWQTVATLAPDVRSHVDRDLASPVLYHYRVAAFNDAGASDYSPSVTAGIGLRALGAELYDSLACAGCHGNDGSGGSTQVAVTNMSDITVLTQKIAANMPLGNSQSCDQHCAAAIAEFILADLVTIDPGCDPLEAGPRQLRLLTRREYENTIDDLLGITTGVTADFPVEVRVAGYDNNAAAAVVTTRHVDAYLAAAKKLAARAVSENRGGLLSCDPADDAAACALEFATTFGQRAYRRPLDATEVENIAALFGSDPSEDFDSGMETALTSILMSPHFLYRSEIGQPIDATHARLDAWEVATSLSYLFWGSTPDPALLAAAAAGELESEEQIVAQAERLLADPRARRQLGVFVAQWLDADPVMAGNKDTSAFPTFNRAVREAQFQELESFANHVFFDRSGQFEGLFVADYVMANDTLAEFYELDAVPGLGFEEVPVQSGQRGGILTLGSVLSSHAHSDDSSPVRRGVFVRERLLCQDLPPPPPDVDNTPPGLDPSLTTRERFTAHSDDPVCQSCHQYIDEVGFGFQHFDGAGRYRSLENSIPIDSRGSVLGIEDMTPGSAVAFDGLAELSALLAQSRAAQDCLPTQLARYAMGQEEGEALLCSTRQLQDAFEANAGDLRELLLDLVRLPSFTTRRLQ